jgi:hypothetical protein
MKVMALLAAVAFSAIAQSPLRTQFFGPQINGGLSAIAADSSGNVFAALSSGYLAKVDPNFQTSFLASLPARISRLNAMALDSAGDVYLTGQTTATAIPPDPFEPNRIGCDPSTGCNSDAFVMRIDGKSGDRVWVTYLGGRLADAGTALAVAADGSVFVGGTTYSRDFPTTTDAWISGLPASPAGFVARLSSDGKTLLSSTYWNGAVQALALDASGAVYVTGQTSDPSPGTPGAYQTAPPYVNLMASSDGGTTWTDLAAPARVIWVEPDRQNAGRLYAGIVSGLAVSSDGGVSWSAVAGPFAGVPVTRVRVDPSDSGTIYAAAATDSVQVSAGVTSSIQAIWKTRDAGVTWSKLIALDSFDPGLWLDPNVPSTLYVTYGSNQGTMQSKDAGLSWSSLPTPRANGFAGDASTGEIYIGQSSGGALLHSSDAGAHWDSVNDPLRASYYASTPVLASRGTVMYRSAAFPVTVGGFSGQGMRLSHDHGAAWVTVPGVLATAGFVDPGTPAVLYATGGVAGLFASSDLGDTWRSLRAGMDNPNVAQVAVAADGTLYAVGTPQPAAFVAKLPPDLSPPYYFTVYGDTGGISPSAIAVDSLGRAVIAGSTAARSMPVTGGQTSLSGYTDAFVARFSANGTQLDFATFLGGSANDSGNALALSATDEIYVAGGTASTNFPVTPEAFQSQNVARTVAGFLAVLAPDGTLRYSTLLGGSTADAFAAVCLSAGNLYLGGVVGSPDFPGGGPPDGSAYQVAALVQIPLGSAVLPSPAH